MGVGAGMNCARVDRRSGRDQGADRQLGHRVDASLEELGLSLLARAEADQHERFRTVDEVRGVGRRDQRRRVEGRSDPNDVRGVVRVGFELGGDRHQCHVASVMGVTEPDDRVEPEPGPVGVGDLDPRSEHLDQRAAAKDRVRRVEQRRGPGSGGLRHVQRGEQHAVDQHHVSGLTLEFGSDVAGDLGAEAQILDEEPHFGTGVPGRRRRVPPPVLREGAKSCPTGREQFAGRVVAQHAHVVARVNESSADAQRGHEVARTGPADDQVSTHVAPPTPSAVLDRV